MEKNESGNRGSAQKRNGAPKNVADWWRAEKQMLIECRTPASYQA